MFERIKVNRMNDHVYLMDDAKESTGYLVVGSQKALVIDTMNGYENVYDVVRTITELPVIVVNTHGHCDHIYGNIYFEEAFMNPDDLPVARRHMKEPQFLKMCEEKGLKMPPFSPIHGGDVIDLGNLHVEIADLPGHTPGGILLLLKEDRILFTGDSINHQVWMQLEESLSMADYVKNLEKVMYLEKEADIILHGHALKPDNITLLEKVLQGARKIAEGKTSGDEPFQWFGGDGKDRQHPYDDDGSVICYR